MFHTLTQIIHHGSTLLEVLGFLLAGILLIVGIVSIIVLNSLVHNYGKDSRPERKVTITWFIVLIISFLGAILFFLFAESNIPATLTIIG